MKSLMAWINASVASVIEDFGAGGDGVGVISSADIFSETGSPISEGLFASPSDFVEEFSSLEIPLIYI
jgi:hypothetical protein